MAEQIENQSSRSIRELNDRFEALEGTLGEVRSRLNELFQDHEDFISFRLFDNARSLLIKWIGIWVGAAIFFLGITGVVSYFGVVNKATDHFSKVVMPNVEKDIREHFVGGVNEIVNRESANISEILEKRFQEYFQDFAKQLGQELEKPKLAKIEPKRAALKKEGWAYIGNFENGIWVTRYFEFPKNTDPSSLVQMSPHEVRRETGALNVRKGMPNPVGQMSQGIDVLKAGSKVEILEVKEWYSSGYMWARIKYED